MKIKEINLTSCKDCSYNYPSDGEASSCWHPNRANNIPYGAVENSEVDGNPPPEGCPLRKEPETFILRVVA